MVQKNAAVAIYAKPSQTQKVVTELVRSGFDLKRLSVMGKAYQEQKEMVAYYIQGERIMCWGQMSGFWNKLSAMIRGGALFSIPGTGPLLVIGPISLWIVVALENSAIFGGLSALGATLYSLGLTKESIHDYEEALRKGNYLVIVHGPAQAVMEAKRVFKSMEIASSV